MDDQQGPSMAGSIRPNVQPRPLVSVLLPVYNGARYIGSALESITRQTYENLQVLVIDDGSTDETPELLSRLAASDVRITVIRTENRGLVTALNRAIKEAEGTLSARMDADDIAEPPRIELQVEHMLRHPECVAVGSHATNIDETGTPFSMQPAVKTGFLLPDRCQSFQRFPPAPPVVMHPTALLRTDAMRRIGGYRPYFKNGAEDRDLWWRLSTVGDIHCLPQRLLKYRVHEANRSHTLRQGATADMLVGDLSAVCRHFGYDDTQILETYAMQQDLPGTIDAYEKLAGQRYPVWALHAYRVLRRRTWSLAGTSSPFAFRGRSLVRALASLNSRPSRYVLGASIR